MAVLFAERTATVPALPYGLLASVSCTFLAVAVAAPIGTARQQVSHTEAGPYVNDAQGLSWQGKGNDQNGKAGNAFSERSEHRPLGPPEALRPGASLSALAADRHRVHMVRRAYLSTPWLVQLAHVPVG